MKIVIKVSKSLFKSDFVRFCAVGALGFLINALFLKIFFNFVHFRIFVAQALAAEIALFINFLLHHHWTYKANGSKKTKTQLLTQFHATSWVAILGSALIVSVLVNNFNLSILSALIVSSAVALFWNFFWTKFVIWKSEIGDKKHED